MDKAKRSEHQVWEAIARSEWEKQSKYAKTAMMAAEYTAEAIADKYAPLEGLAFSVVCNTLLKLYDERLQREAERAELNK